MKAVLRIDAQSRGVVHLLVRRKCMLCQIEHEIEPEQLLRVRTTCIPENMLLLGLLSLIHLCTILTGNNFFLRVGTLRLFPLEITRPLKTLSCRFPPGQSHSSLCRKRD